MAFLRWRYLLLGRQSHELVPEFATLSDEPSLDRLVAHSQTFETLPSTVVMYWQGYATLLQFAVGSYFAPEYT